VKVRTSVKKICTKCKVIRRAGVVRVICENRSTSSGKDDRLQRKSGVTADGSYQRHRPSPNKRVEIGLTYIFGIGRPSSNRILSTAGVGANTRVKDLSEDEVSRIRKVIQEDYKVEGDLRKDTSQDIKRLMEIGCYRGLRHRRNLPVRGQRTHTNARTRRARGRVPSRARRRRRRSREGCGEPVGRVPPHEQKENTDGNTHRNHRRGTESRQGQEKGPRRKRRTSRTRSRRCRRPSTTRSSRSPTTRECPGLVVGGRIGFKGSRKGTPFAAQLPPATRRSSRRSTASARWTSR